MAQDIRKREQVHRWRFGLALVLCVLVIPSRRHTNNFLDPRLPRFEGPIRGDESLGRPTLTGDTFSVVSFNIHFGYQPERVITAIRDNRMAAADVVLLQEADERSVKLISEDLRMEYVYYPAAVHPTSRNLFGVAVLSRWPIKASRKILLPGTSYIDAARKVCMAAIVEIDGVPIEVVNVHLQSGLLRRAYREQVETVVRCVLEARCEGDLNPEPLPPRRALVFGGDFNTWEKGLRTSLEKAMSEVPLKRVDGIVATFAKLRDREGKRQTLDYFFVSEDLYFKAGRVGASRTGSDHHPIEAELRLPREPRSIAPTR